MEKRQCCAHRLLLSGVAGWLVVLCGYSYAHISEVRNSSHALKTELVFLDQSR
jgi:hypothetical protein